MHSLLILLVSLFIQPSDIVTSVFRVNIPMVYAYTAPTCFFAEQNGETVLTIVNNDAYHNPVTFMAYDIGKKTFIDSYIFDGSYSLPVTTADDIVVVARYPTERRATDSCKRLVRSEEMCMFMVFDNSVYIYIVNTLILPYVEVYRNSFWLKTFHFSGLYSDLGTPQSTYTGYRIYQDRPSVLLCQY